MGLNMSLNMMKRYVCFVVLAVIIVAPLFAQAPAGWKMRVDRSMNASDPDAPGSAKLAATPSGFHATNPQAAVYWNPANTATGNYTLKATFTLTKTMSEEEYYGLVFAGSGLEGAAQNYIYFMVAADGTWLVKRRNGDSTANVSQKTSSPAVKKPGANGMSTNVLEVRVMADKVDFVVNGTVVSSMPKTGQLAKPDGIYGMRVNHMLEVNVDGLAVSK
jgi:hypothetical protein